MGDHYEPEEVITKLDRISDEEYISLVMSAHYFSLGLPLGPEDLLNEALERLVSGQRAWPRGLALRTCVYGIIRSISGHERNKAWNQAELVGIGENDNEVQVSGTEPDAEAQLMALAQSERSSTILGELRAIVSNNKNAKQVLDHRLDDGFNKREIIEASGMNETEYLSATKTISRGVKKLAAKYGEHNEQSD